MMSAPKITQNLLEPRQDAEDECVRDLRKTLQAEAGLTEERPFTRSISEPSSVNDTPVTALPDPEIGRFRDVANPGGFRRLHLKQSSGASESVANSSSLVALLLPMLNECDLVDEDGTPRARVERIGGDTSNLKVAFVIAKNFFGSCFMITPKGFEEAGMLGGPMCLIFVYVLEAVCMLNLIKCRNTAGSGRYEELGACVGPQFVKIIRGMIILCQFGFCCIWLVTNSENLSMVFPDLSYTHRLWLQLPLLFPLVWVRHLRLFAVSNLIGIFFTIVMVIFFFGYMTNHLIVHGPREVVMINTQNSDLLLWLGTCSYAYEGINIVLPTYESARDKESMPKLLIGITAANTIMYISFGMLTYYAFGTDVASLASLNLRQGSTEGYAVPLTSIIIGLVSFPLQAFVIFQTYEPKLPWSRNYHARKWQKNAVRFGVLFFTIAVTWAGGNQLQNFLALVGGFCCASLALIFPSILHIMICKPKSLGLMVDGLILLSGVFILILSTTQALASWK